jgi:nicotinamide mononucleotide transporter
MLDTIARLWSVEAVAVWLAVAYLILAAQENLWCWVCAFVSSALYTWVFWSVNLYMEAALNVFYVVMAVVGWRQWRAGTGESGFGIRTLSLQQHVLLVSAMLAMAALNGWVMGRFTDAAWPFVDSFTTWSSIITTVLVVRKVLENWLYWLVIDSISIWLYVDRGLYLTVLLFAVYLVIVVFGYINWRRDYLQQQAGLHDNKR